ncbi:hypothetical protein PQ456_22510 [Paenibacillus kyungheensis]|uniref:Phosphoglycerate mutase n=1 Tax=Paenibacillus kyungheensis TaxID=1452732 RepID=A0AAX3M0U3_9BACL|nr:hypothetical protein [Paenibacillus kyungheensis]WCT55884.1 hypothetical protein PQ456_22510 [Paenibacillus kyungheensis]
MTNLFYIVRHAIKEKLIGDVDITAQGIIEAKKNSTLFSTIKYQSNLFKPSSKS